MGGAASRCMPGKAGGAASAPGGAATPVALGSAKWEAHLPRLPGEPPHILFLGDAGSGKTSLLEVLHTRLPARQLRTPPPSTQPRAFDLSAKGMPFTAIDQPGAEKLRAWWVGALREADGVVLACDSSDSLKLQLKLLHVSFTGLVPLLNAAKVPLMLLATKQDVQGSVPPGRLAAELSLVSEGLTVPFAARGVTLLGSSVEALEEALSWVVEHARPARPPRPKRPPRPPASTSTASARSDDSAKGSADAPRPKAKGGKKKASSGKRREEEEDEEEEEEAPPPVAPKPRPKKKGGAHGERGGYNVRTHA